MRYSSFLLAGLSTFVSLNFAQYQGVSCSTDPVTEYANCDLVSCTRDNDCVYFNCENGLCWSWQGRPSVCNSNSS